MINLIKKENLNLSILETDFDVYADIVNTFDDEVLKRDSIYDLDDYTVPKYFRNKLVVVVQSNNMLIGYAIFSFNNDNKEVSVVIDKLVVLPAFKNKNMEIFLIEGVVYISGEVGSRSIKVNLKDETEDMIYIYKQMGFYNIGGDEDIYTVNVASVLGVRKLNDKFRNIPEDAIDYKSLKLTKKITTGRSANIYLTDDGKIFKMFTSTSFTYIKDREETLKELRNLDIKEVVKPKRLVYYNGVFVGYLMDYLPNGKSLSELEKEKLSFEDKISKIRSIEIVMQKLHEKNIYVCDLNPDNIFFDTDGNVNFIDCDSFVTKKNVINTSVDNKFIDPFNKVVNEKTDLYAFAVTILELLLGVDIDKDYKYGDIEKIYSKNKGKLPVSFKSYFDLIFNSKDRLYLSDAYEKYVSEMYDKMPNDVDNSQKSGNISMIILSFLAILIALIGYIAFKKGG